MNNPRAGFSYSIAYDTRVEAPIEDAFAFVTDPHSLPKFDPPELEVRLMSARGAGRAGGEIEYVLRWFGIPLYLRMKVIEYRRPELYVVEQKQGPALTYTNRFQFREEQGGTVISQLARLEAAPGWANVAIHRWIIRRQVRAVHAYRRTTLPQLMRGVQEPAIS